MKSLAKLRFLGTIALGVVIFMALVETAYADGSKPFTRNVALEKTVAVSGEFFVESPRFSNPYVVDFGTVADGVFFPPGQRYDRGPVWWNEEDGMERSLIVFLGDTFVIRRIKMQADNNDDYLVSWDDVKGGPMEVVVSPDASGGGIAAPVTVRVDAITDRFMIKHLPGGRGDNLYSVAEFEAHATGKWRQ